MAIETPVLNGPLVEDLPTVLGELSRNDFDLNGRIAGAEAAANAAVGITSRLGTAALCDIGTTPGTVADGSSLATTQSRVSALQTGKVDGLSNLSAGAPASLGIWNDPSTAFTGDLSKTPLATGKTISGAGAAGSPSAGYTFYHELASVAQFTKIMPEVGVNAQTGTNDGRTGVAMNAASLAHYGNGDAFTYWGSAFVSGAKAGATHFLANPAVSLLGGQSLAGANGVLLQGIGDINLIDNGYDVAGIAFNANLIRTNNTGALGADWIVYRAQSHGSKPIGAAFSATGPTRVGLDLTTVSLAADLAAITLPPGGRIYGNTKNDNFAGLPKDIAVGTTWLDYDLANSAWRFVIENSVAMLASADQVTASVPMLANAGLTVNGSVSASGTIKPQSYTVATLPTPGTSGRIAKASNGRALSSGGALEAAGSGTGCLVEDSGAAWRIVGTNIPVSA